MGLLQFFFFETHLQRYQHLMRLAEQAADTSFERVWQRVQARIFSLQPAEARGYVRARARAVLEPVLAELAGNLGASARSRVHALAMDATIRRVSAHVQAAWSGQRLRRAA